MNILSILTLSSIELTVIDKHHGAGCSCQRACEVGNLQNGDEEWRRSMTPFLGSVYDIMLFGDSGLQTEKGIKSHTQSYASRSL